MPQTASFRAGDQVIMIAPEPHYGDVFPMPKWRKEQTVLTVQRVDEMLVRIQDLAVHDSVLRHADPELAKKLAAERKAEEERLASLPVDGLIEEAKKLLRAVRQRGDNGIACHIKHGKPVEVKFGPCHGFIRNAGGPKTASIVTLINRTKSQHEQKQVSEKVALRWFDFIFNRSPWAECFEEKDALVAWNSFSVAMNVSAPANLLQGALMTTRHTWEKNTRVELWYKLVNLGVDERHAFLAMNFASFSSDQVSLSAISSDHSPVGANHITKVGVKRFMTKPKKTMLTQAYNKGGSYEGVKAMWNEGTGEIQQSFNKAFSEACKESMTAVVINPFMKAKASTKAADSMSVERYAAFVTSFFTEITVK